MALPGTELFRTLVREGRGRHRSGLLPPHSRALSLIPTTSYSEQLGRAALFYWKLRFVAAFYLARLRVLGPKRLLASVQTRSVVARRAPSFRPAFGLSSEVESRPSRSSSASAGSRPRKRTRLFEPWDAIYREISQRRRDDGVEIVPRSTRASCRTGTSRGRFGSTTRPPGSSSSEPPRCSGQGLPGRERSSVDLLLDAEEGPGAHAPDR